MSEVPVSLPFLKIASTPLTIEMLRLDGEISCLFEFLLFNYINFTPKTTLRKIQELTNTGLAWSNSSTRHN